MIVLAVDVGIQVCGYVLCKIRNLDVELLKEGEIKPPRKDSLPKKLNQIYASLEEEIKEFVPSAVLVEKLYSHYRYPTTLGVLAEVRGVVALLSHRHNLEFFEFSPTRARKAFLGKGNVNSEQVKKMAENVTGQKFKSVHTADAYSLAAAYSHMVKKEQLNDIANKR